MFGDWGGFRTALKAEGVDLSVDYIGQAAANVSGGRGSGADYAQQLQLKADIDWGKLTGLTGFSTHAILVIPNATAGVADQGQLLGLCLGIF